MSIAKPSSQFFGLDLSALWPDVRRAWQGVHQWPILRWLTPSAPVRVLHADGRETTWLGGQKIPAAPTGLQCFEAIEIPDDLLLRRSLNVPFMAQAQVAQAVELDVRSANPFAVADLLWGYNAQPEQQDGLRIEAVMASRKQAERYITTQRHRLKPTSDTAVNQHEVWAFTLDNAPIVLPGWGETRRVQHGARRRHAAYALIAAAACLVAAMAATPTMQLRLRALEAVHAFEALQARTTSMVGQREAYMRSVAQLESLKGLLEERAEPLSLLETLTRTLPDDTSLQSMEVRGLKVTLSGLTGNAATLMQLLGAIEGFREVRAPSPATRNPGADAENFIVELQLDPAVFSMAASATSALRPKAALASSSEGSTAGTVPAGIVAVPNATPSNGDAIPSAAGTGAAPPRRKSRFSSGPEDLPAAAPSQASVPAPSAPSAARKTAP